MIKAVLFDYGGVILESPFDAFARYEVERGLPAGFLRRVNATNSDANAWAKLERNEVDLPGFARLFEQECRSAGHEVVGSEVLQLLSGQIRPEMVEAVRRCHARRRTAVLTNNFVAMDESPRDHAEVLQHFDAVIESVRIGVRKPDPRFYEIACETLAISPEEAVFLDDLGINLKPARAMGMTTIKVEDPDVAIGELEAVVGFPLRADVPVGD